MKRFGFFVLAAICAVTMISLPAQAAGPLSLGLGGGFTMPVGDSQDALKNGFHLRGIAEAHLPMVPLGLRAALGYQKLDLKDLASSAGYSNGQSSILSGLAGFTFSLISVGPVRPYVTASLGAFHVKGEVDSSSTSLTKSQTKFGIDGGVGAKLGIGPLKGFVEARMENVYTDQGWNPAVSNLKSARFIPITFGITF
jgi:hypothetical protein